MTSGKTQRRIGQNQVRRASERPPEAPLGLRLSNKDTLKLARAGAKNIVEGTIMENRKKQRLDKPTLSTK